ncbi:hypothetical protein NIES267_74320 (plasmid) [Calothrix parasitica NIES-267]|uniref:Uncharacterized protein n=1 Tax=Calothrix parasitica NIES-267 TaxID=1973488 RepID=A0A1Z4M3F1_9CYAN|nr:hypothetical protein NIES267_74320 [Calothrix parasitica NIES-267]
MNWKDFFDEYSLQARLLPAFCTLFPIFVTVAVWFPGLYQFVTGTIALVISVGLLVWLTHITRSRGRELEKKLFSKWGGIPSAYWLRQNDTHLDSTTKQRYYSFLEKDIPNWKVPTLAEEQANQTSADEMYRSASKWLLERTRDTSKFKLIFKENISYGFRRNLLGMKPFGITINLICIIGAIFGLYKKYGISVNSIEPQYLSTIILSTVLTIAWLSLQEEWVHDAADAFARSLLAACDQLEIETPSKQQQNSPTP